MKTNVLLMLLVGGCLGNAFGQTPYASLQVPKQIQYQGRVATATGAAWSGTEGYFSFALVQGATVLWNNWEGTASPSDPGTVSLGAGQVLTLPVNQGVFSVRLGEGSDINEQIPPTVFFDTVSNSVRTGVKLAMWFSPDGGTFTRLSPDVDFTSVPYAMVSGIAETVKERAVSAASLSEAVMQALIPPGTILPYAGTTAPGGFLMCNGDPFPKASYPALAAVLNNGPDGAAFGGTSTHFNVPDLRGRFLRGTDDPDGAGSEFNAAGLDPGGRSPMKANGNTGNSVGTVQGGATARNGLSLSGTTTFATADHTHGPGSLTAKIVFGGNAPGTWSLSRVSAPSSWTANIADRGYNGPSGVSTTQTDGVGIIGSSSGPSASAAVGLSAGDSETRPLNANVNYIIKY